MISFTVFTTPIAQPRQRMRTVNRKDGKSFIANYTPAKHPVTSYKGALMGHGSMCLAGEPLLQGPLHMEVTFVMPRPKGKFWKTKAMPRYPHIGRPDIDNLYKSLADALEGVIYKNDSQIMSTRLLKVVASGYEQPHVQVEICPYSAGTLFAGDGNE